ncbi:hypothetical protein [Actinomadura rugatobispora]|uniref:Uncharacterized protein n=1 Tax=Actinomadura rugatobispora TaxID=1994 RepID=A0ABW1A5Q1_9ACTN|nr:hypothetical protein GCM10010200_041420 [Actinomadura rugatobispora]
MGEADREPPPELVAEAAAHPGGWVYEIDSGWVDEPDGYLPVQAILGAWKVAGDGRLTGEFRENERHRPPGDDFSALTGSDHWLGDDPAAAVLAEVVDILNRQVDGTVVEWMQVLEEPRFRRDGAERTQVTRAALALSLVLMARTPEGRRLALPGVLTWVAAGLDRPAERRDRVWFELGVDLDRAEERLRERIRELDRPE